MYPILADMVEIGSDIPTGSAEGDGPCASQAGLWSRLTLWGTLDIQEVLPLSTPEDVAAEVRLRCGQPAAAHDTAKEYARYPIRDA